MATRKAISQQRMILLRRNTETASNPNGSRPPGSFGLGTRYVGAFVRQLDGLCLSRRAPPEVRSTSACPLPSQPPEAAPASQEGLHPGLSVAGRGVRGGHGLRLRRSPLPQDDGRSAACRNRQQGRRTRPASWNSWSARSLVSALVLPIRFRRSQRHSHGDIAWRTTWWSNTRLKQADSPILMSGSPGPWSPSGSLP